MRRRPVHAKPLVGASFSVGFAAFLAAAGLVLGFREGLGIEGVLAPVAFAAFPAVFGVTLFWLDLGMLKLANRERPPRYRALWRRMWVTVPPLALAAGAVAGALAPIDP